jgi:AAA domain
MTEALIDFAGINYAALARGRTFLETLIPGGKFRSLEYIVRNPTRDDKNPGSFTINYRTGIWKDFATGDGGSDLISLLAYVRGIGQGDAAREMAGKIGMPLPKSNSDYANGKDHSRQVKTVVAEFEYHDLYGNTVLAVERIEFQKPDGTFVLKDGKRDKTFRQKRPDPDHPGKWINNAEDVPVVPYRLPQLIEAIANDHPILIVEGEAKADLLASWNIAATCCVGGAKKWKPGHSEFLRGVDVFLLPDNDSAGWEHINKVGASLSTIAKAVRVVTLPGLKLKGDIIDWAKAGGTREQLDAMLETAPAWDEPSENATTSNGKNTNTEARTNWRQDAFTAEQLQRMKFDPISWLVSNIIPAEGVTLLCSRPKFGKSWLAYDLCIGATMDRFILGEIKPAQGYVLYQALEDSKRRLKRRMTKLLPTFSGKWPDSLTITTKWRRLHEGGLDDIRGWYEDTKAKAGQPIMVVIDVLAKVRKPTGGKAGYEADYEALTGLCHLARELNIAIVVIHHTRKMAADDLMETVNGSYGLTGAVDTVLVMASKAGGSVLDVRGRDVESAELAVQFSKDTCRWTILGAAADIHQSDQRKKIIAVLIDSSEPMRIGELAAATGMTRNPLELLLGRMVKDGLIKRTGVGRYAHKDYVELATPNEADKRKSVRSVSSILPVRQMKDERQAAENIQEGDGICLSVRSVRDFTGTTNFRDPAAERVKTQTDETDPQIDAQAAEERAILRSGDLSGPETDQTDQTEMGVHS